MTTGSGRPLRVTPMREKLFQAVKLLVRQRLTLGKS